MTGDMPFEQDPRGWIIDLLSARLQASQRLPSTCHSFGLNGQAVARARILRFVRNIQEPL